MTARRVLRGSRCPKPYDISCYDYAEEVERYTPSAAQDSVRLYLREIARVPLLTAAQEVELGRRIEVGQTELRRPGESVFRA